MQNSTYIESVNSIGKKCLSKLDSLRNSSKEIDFFFSRLETIDMHGTFSLCKIPPKFTYSYNGIVIFGGAIRDWFLDFEPKDIDIVISSPHFEQMIDPYRYNQRNLYGGYRFKIDNVNFDIWSLWDTYALRHQLCVNWYSLVESVPFTTDAIAMTTHGSIYETYFRSCVNNKKISFVNSDHPDPKFLARRALKQKYKYGFSLSDSLQKYVEKHLSKNEIEMLSLASDKDYIYASNAIQYKLSATTMAMYGAGEKT